MNHYTHKLILLFTLIFSQAFGQVTQSEFGQFMGWWKNFTNNNGSQGAFLDQATANLTNNQLSSVINVTYDSNEGISLKPRVSFNNHYGHNIIFHEKTYIPSNNVTLDFTIEEFSLDPDAYNLVAYILVLDTENYWNQVQLKELIVDSPGSYQLSIAPVAQQRTRYLYHLGFELRGPMTSFPQAGRVLISDFDIIYTGYPESSILNYYDSNFSFGSNSSTNQGITWTQEIVDNPSNNEIQKYRSNKVGIDADNNLVLRIDRQGTNTYHSSRVNSSPTDEIRIGDGEKLSIEFRAQLPQAKDATGNTVSNVPLWPALWIMGNEQKNGSWIGWPFCSEIDAMEWSPTRGITQQNVAYHWNENDGDTSGYNHTYDVFYHYDTDLPNDFHTWRVDIYRYHPDQNLTNKIEVFYDDVFISESRFEESSLKDNSEFWYPVTNQNPENRSTGEKPYFLIMNIAMGGWYPGTSTVPDTFEYAEMVVDYVTYQRSSIYNSSSGHDENAYENSIETTLNLEFTGVFGDLDYTGEGSYNFPSSAQDWAGVANVADSFYPLSLPSGGTIKFNGRVPSGGDLDLEFKFERLPYDSEGNAEESTLPSFYTQPITISGNETREYEVTIPPQNVNHTFSSLIMYFRDRNQSAILTDFQILKETQIPKLSMNHSDGNTVLSWSDENSFEVKSSYDLETWESTNDTESPFIEPMEDSKFYILSIE